MKFRDAEGNDYLFDKLPKVFNPTQLVFFTHLHHLNDGPLKLPLKLPTIYTTKCIAEKLISAYPLTFNSAHFRILTPFEPLAIQLYNGKTVTIFACEEDDCSLGNKLMILIKKPDKQMYVYAGICTYLRNTVLSNAFVNMLSDGTVSELILHLIPAGCALWTECVHHITHAKTIIEKIHDFNLDQKFRIVIPTFGFEPLISRIVFCFDGRVHISDAYPKLLENFNSECLQSNADEAFIQITNKLKVDSSSDRHTIRIVDITTPDADVGTVYKWSPYPTAFELLFLIALLKPKHIINSCGTVTAPTNYLNEHEKLLRRHPDNSKLRTPSMKTHTLNATTPSSETRIPPAQSLNSPSTPHTTTTPPPHRSTMSCPQTVNSPTAPITGRRSTSSKDDNTLAPFVIRRRGLEYASDDSSS